MEIQTLADHVQIYLTDVARYLDEHRETSTSTLSLRRIEALPSAIRHWFDVCERFDSWKTLVREWGKVLDDSDWVVDRRSDDLFPFDAAALKAWFRRRGVYTDLVDRGNATAANTVQRLIADSKVFGDKSPITYAALLRTVDYSWEERTGLYSLNDLFLPSGLLDLGDFRIGNLDTPALEQLLEVATNRLFYPAAVTSIPKWSYHCYCLVKGDSGRRGHRDIRRVSVTLRGRTITGYAEPEAEHYPDDSERWVQLPSLVEHAYGKLLLWKWQWAGDFGSKSIWEARLLMTSIVRIEESPFRAPTHSLIMGDDPVPTTSWPFSDLVGDEEEAAFRDDPAAFGERYGNHVLYGKAAAEDFKTFIHDQTRRLNAIFRYDQWRGVVNLALGFLVKSILAEHDVEKLLWSMVALESLLGEKDRSTAIGKRLNVLCDPIIRISISDPPFPSRVDKLFLELYDVRCRLVHGDSIGEENAERLRASRRLAGVLSRAAIARMVYLLGEMAMKNESNILLRMPSRNEIVEAIDALAKKKDTTFLPLARTIDEILSSRPHIW